MRIENLKSKSVEELIETLATAEGVALHAAITELGNRGAAAADATWSLLELISDHEDEAARGHAMLAVGLVDPVCGAKSAEIVDWNRFERDAARDYARSLHPEVVEEVMGRLLEAPLGKLVGHLPRWWP